MTWLTFHLSEWIANQLNPLVKEHCPDVLRDSTELIQNLLIFNERNIITRNVCLISADVEALYPSMDTDLGLNLMNNFLEKHNLDSNLISFILWAMKFVLTQGYIEFENEIYQQTNGAAMGSPMIPPYANIFMHMLEDKVVKQFTALSGILMYKRFIDDVFIILDGDNIDINTLKETMNNMAPCIKLTWTEPIKAVDFLDLTISINLKNKL